MKALSLLQPWASLVAIGAKLIETRSWYTAYRGPLLIAASQKWTSKQGRLIKAEPFHSTFLQVAQRWSAEHGQPRPFPLTLGCILCVVDLTHCVPITSANTPPDPERSFGDYTPGRYAWHMATVRRLERPVPAKGSLGLWTPDPATLEAVMEQIA